jgi:hypothetical protein
MPQHFSRSYHAGADTWLTARMQFAADEEISRKEDAMLPHPTDWPPLWYGDPWLTSRSRGVVTYQRHELALACYLEKQEANRASNAEGFGRLHRILHMIRRRLAKTSIGDAAAAPHAIPGSRKLSP